MKKNPSQHGGAERHISKKVAPHNCSEMVTFSHTEAEIVTERQSGIIHYERAIERPVTNN